MPHRERVRARTLLRERWGIRDETHRVRLLRAALRELPEGGRTAAEVIAFLQDHPEVMRQCAGGSP